jgi:hypothetical protein
MKDRFVQTGLIPVFVPEAEFAREMQAHQKMVAELVRSAKIPQQ